MQLLLPELESVATLSLHRQMSSSEFEAFCADNPGLRVELSADGEIDIMPPAGADSSYRNADVCTQLRLWAKRDKRGKVFDSSAAFILPSGAILSPDTSWVSNAKLESLTREQKRKFLPLVPDFIVEVLSPSDRLPAAHAKMAQWIASGVPLAWLIDGDAQTVTIYRPGTLPEICQGKTELRAVDPISGFELDLTEIWAGLD